MKRADLLRPASSRRGYGGEWPRIRAEVLRAAGIPEADWPLYDVDHVPRWPTLGSDHSRYQLVPRRHGRHSGLTMRETRAGIEATWKLCQPPPGELFSKVLFLRPERFLWEDF